jgi:hypothetical protein
MRPIEMSRFRWPKASTTVTTADAGVGYVTECIAGTASTGSTATEAYPGLLNQVATVLPELHKGRNGWLYIAAGVIAWDVLNKEDEQLTRAFRRGLQTPEGRLLIGLTWGVLTAHLFDALPKQYDPIHQLGEHIFAMPRRKREQHAR